MPLLSIAEQIALARRHEFTDAEIPDVCAVIMTESGGDTEAVQRNGLGRGLVQIDLGQHPTVTEEQAFDPDFAMAFARRLSRNASGLGPTNWYGPRDHPETAAKARSDARAVLAQEGTPMEEWMPGVEHVDRGGSVPVQDAGPTVIVLHTTETEHRASYSGSEPHFEIDRDGSIRQYISLAHTAKALYNYPGTGVETNRRRGRIFQWELVNRASGIHDITDAQLDGLAESLRWVDSQRPFAKTGPPQGWFGSESAGEGSDARFSFDEWEAFSGICGHQHVPENDHWDPGHFPLERLLSRLGAGPVPPAPPTEEEVTMIVFDGPPARGGGVWKSDGVFRNRINAGETWPALEKAGAKHIGVAPIGLFDDLIDVDELRLNGNAGGVDLSAIADRVAARVADLIADRLAS